MNVLDRISNKANERLLALMEKTGLALEFSWQGDRWAQRLTAILGGIEYPIAKSHEFVSQDGQPISQAFQDISRQRVSNAELIFLVGLANKAYWSTSVEVLPSGRGFQWDVSCKPADAVELRCEYIFSSPAKTHHSQLVTLKLPDNWNCVIECESVSPNETQCVVEDQHLKMLTANIGPISKRPVRWKYRCELRQEA